MTSALWVLYHVYRPVYIPCMTVVVPCTAHKRAGFCEQSTWWQKLLEHLGTDCVRLHDARHSCATLLHLRGTPIAVIAAWLGHASAAFTMATYAHSQDEALKTTASSFGRVVTMCDTETGSGS